MKAIVNTKANTLEMLELPTPEPKHNQVRIKTAACAICATDLEIIAGWDRTKFPTIPGHEWSGIVDEVGPDIDTNIIGQHCVGNNVLSDGGEVGFEHPGGYAEYFLTEYDKLQFLTEDYPFYAATMIEPLSVALRGMKRLREDCQGPFLVFGDGPIGLLTVQLLASRGEKDITIVGGRDIRLKLALEFGAGSIINYHNLNELVKPLLDFKKSGYGTIIEGSGSEKAIEASLKLISPGGKILILSYYNNESIKPFPWNNLLVNEIEIIGSNTGDGSWAEAVVFAIKNTDALEQMISHRIPVNQFQKGIDMMLNKDKDVIKIVLEWL